MRLWLILTCVNVFILPEGSLAADKKPESICFEELGCFSDDGPFNTPQRPITSLPNTPEEINTQFLLYSKETPSEFTLLDYHDEDQLRQSSFNSSQETKIIIHGYRSFPDKPWVHRLVEEFYKHDDFNVMSVDWMNGSFVNYPAACSNGRVVGVQISLLLKALRKAFGEPNLQFHLIGHSMGAHVAGYVGEKVQIKRITALDPSGPYFESTDTAVRLDPTDATFVDAIHTDSGTALDFGLGMRQSIGHIDFFPNGGKFQPGCPHNKFPATIVGGIVGWLNNITLKESVKTTFLCSHKRSEFLFVESINTPCSFTTYECNSEADLHSGKCVHTDSATGRLGYHADKALGRGRHMLETFDAAPFCAYHYQVNISGLTTINGFIYLTLHGTNGKSESIDITGHNKLLTPHDHFVTSMKGRVNIGELKSVEVKYVETDSLIGFLFNDEWELESLTVFAGTTQKLSHFCVKGAKVVSQTSQKFDVMSECP